MSIAWRGESIDKVSMSMDVGLGSQLDLVGFDKWLSYRSEKKKNQLNMLLEISKLSDQENGGVIM